MTTRRRPLVTLYGLREAVLDMIECCAIAAAIIGLALWLDALAPIAR